MNEGLPIPASEAGKAEAHGGSLEAFVVELARYYAKQEIGTNPTDLNPIRLAAKNVVREISR